MKTLRFTSSIVITALALLFILTLASYAQDKHTVYLPVIMSNADGTQTVQPDQPSTLPDYNSLALDIAASLTKTQLSALNYINNPPNATTTITNVKAIETGLLLTGSLGVKAYTYSHVTKTLDETCINIKTARPGMDGVNYVTLTLTACYADDAPSYAKALNAVQRFYNTLVAFPANYTTLALDVDNKVVRLDTANAFVTNPPNATTTITNVQTLDHYEMGDLVGTIPYGAAYSYNHHTKTINETCLNLKAARYSDPHYLTINTVSCYSQPTIFTDPKDTSHPAYMMLDRLVELYAGK